MKQSFDMNILKIKEEVTEKETSILSTSLPQPLDGTPKHKLEGMRTQQMKKF